ncbi:Penicillinase repressor [Acetatifactor muris]|uniref:Penicillinase repressor n=1 Tax=Acetatifactor muris TaxID=879566 RepID=A0A2K4ZDD7_9FIRM|nr:Penicillinase repressor [Acetatifactor muris]
MTLLDYCDSLYMTSDYCNSPILLLWKNTRYRKGESVNIKLFDSELKVMEVLWEQGPQYAKDIVDVLSERIGWNKNTTYTVIKKCMEKGAVERTEPGFLCTPLVTREEVAQSETEQLIDKMFGGSSELFFSSFLKNQGISEEDAVRLARMIEEAK